MKRRTTKKTILPELIAEIFLRLPVKPLLRFKCVSKSLCSLIDSPNFIKQHLGRSMEAKTNRKLIVHEQTEDDEDDEDDSPSWYMPGDIYASNFDEEPQKLRKLNHPVKERLDTAMYGSCNGLLLLLINGRLALWNPFTRQCKKLPVCEETLYRCDFGLGYDCASDDYKVVKISNTRVWVFSLKSNSWRSLPDLPYKAHCKNSFSSSYEGGVLANGALHWLLRGDKIIAFDMANETFCVVPQPVYSSQVSGTQLNVLEGCLCVGKIGFGDRDIEQFELYVREYHGIGFTWRKLCSETGSLRFLQPLAYSKRGDEIWFLDLVLGNKEIICYDIHEKIISRSVQIIDQPHRFYTVLCWESLVPLGDGSEFDGAVSWEIPEPS